MATALQKQKRFSLFTDSGVMDDKNWPKEEVNHRIKQRIKMWEKMQKDMEYTKSPVLYFDLKEEKIGRQKDVLEAAKEGKDVNTFMVIRSHEKHHAIIDTEGEILGYRYRIKPDLLKTLEETTEALPAAKVNARNRGDYPTRHYTVWRDYSAIPFESAEYRKELPASREWCDKNQKLFEYLSEGLRMISPMTYVRYRGAQPYLQDLDLKPLCGIWFGVAINQGVTGSTSSHLDWADSGYNCVVPWGEYTGGRLVLWQLEIIVELEPGDAFFFMGSLIAHNVGETQGVRNSIDLFCHNNVLSWKDKCDGERRGGKLNE
jgi:hypothetical protein